MTSFKLLRTTRSLRFNKGIYLQTGFNGYLSQLHTDTNSEKYVAVCQNAYNYKNPVQEMVLAESAKNARCSNSATTLLQPKDLNYFDTRTQIYTIVTTVQ